MTAELPLLAQSITAEDLGRIPPAEQGPETSGPEAARAAAENGAGDEPESSSAPPPPPGAAAVLFVDMLLVLGVQVAAQRYRVPFRECATLARLTPDERELLAQFAPFAAPYLGAVGEASPLLGALAFGGVAAMVLAGRFRDVRAAAPAPSSPSSSPPPSSGAAPNGARVVDVDHLAKWQGVSDVVPPGTEVRDSGGFPERAGVAPS